MIKISVVKFSAIILMSFSASISANGQIVQPTPGKNVKNPPRPAQNPNRPAEGADNPDVAAMTTDYSSFSVAFKLPQNTNLKGAAVYLLDENFGKVGGKKGLLAKLAGGGKAAEESLAVISSHLKQSVLTDAQGQANFQNVEKRNYFLVAVYRNSKPVYAWNLKVEVKSAKIEINLTSKNAFYRK